MRPLLLALAVLVLAVPIAPTLALADEEPEAPVVSRDLQPVVLTGASFPALAVVANYVERPPAFFSEEARDGYHVPLGAIPGQSAGTPLDEVFAFRFDAALDAFVEIPSQLDERFLRYLTNYASDFGTYSQADAHLTYAFDFEGARKTAHASGDNLTAAFVDPARVTTPDPVPGFDSDDELVFLARDAGIRAPRNRAPADVTALHEVAITDPLTGATTYAYVGGSATRAHAVFEPLVRYARDADADRYVQSNHGGYGGAPGGPCYPGDGVDAPFGEPKWSCDHRRPKDSATVTASSYEFHYSGRWKLDGLHLRQGDGSLSDSVVDRWKGRAFQQREGNAADIGGFEDENDWTRSSVTLGERAGPVRILRETWSADSGTNVVRLDAFYPDFFEQTYVMRVHPIPPDGVYAFWDHREGMMDTFYTAVRPEGVAIDGANDEVYGLNSEWQEDVLGDPYFTIDFPDPTLQPIFANEAWDQVSGPFGSLVTVIHAPDTRSGALTSYYRDDADFDDGTGRDPAGKQGSFGAHGIHFFFTSDTDNAFLPVPVNEFEASVRQYALPGRDPAMGFAVATL